MSQVLEKPERVVVRIAGDSSDGVQLASGRFTDATAALGNDLGAPPNFPDEIRGPAVPRAGVAPFQIHFASRDILTPGDAPNVLVAMNPAALKANLDDLPRGATILVNEDAFTKRNLENAGYTANPLEDGSLCEYRVHRIPMTTMTARAVARIEDASARDAGRAKNLFALGLLSWLYGRPVDVTLDWLRAKFGTRPGPLKANLAAFDAGWSFGLCECVSWLVTNLGDDFTAFVSGLSERTAVRSLGPGCHPDPDTCRRLLRAYEAAGTLVGAYDAETALAWFFGTNQGLGDESPAWLLRHGDVERLDLVPSAALAFVRFAS